MKTVTCTKCPKKFTKPTRVLAEQALRMHVGRKHDRNIVANHEHSGVLRQRSNGVLAVVGAKHPRSHLQGAEVDTIVSFIRDHRSQYDNKTACFTAALEAAGAVGKITNNSTAVNRYYAKADAAVDGDKPAKRKYTKRTAQPSVHHIHVKFCPCCGTN